MFVIVPSSRETSHAASQDYRGPTRTQNACDACRVRKVKCNGAQPCGRCRTRSLVCTYARAAPEFTAPVSAQRAEVLRNQNGRLERAVRCMAARIEALESSLSEKDSHQQLDQGTSHRTSDGWQTDIADLLNTYAPENADSVGRLSTNGDNLSPPNFYQDGNAKKRRVEQTLDRQSDIEAAQSFPPYAIAPASAYHDLAPTDALFQDAEAQADSIDHSGDTEMAPVASLATQDASRQAFQTLLQISRARRERSTMADQTPGIGPANSGIPPAPPENFGPSPAWDVPAMQPDPVNSTTSGNMEDSLFDLVDWDETLQNFMPMSLDWQQGFQ